MNKPNHVSASLLVLLSLVLPGAPPVSRAVPPLPSFRYYGRLSDEYGWPVTLDRNVELVLRIGTNESARCTANEQLGEGINFILEVPVDYPARARYALYAGRTGDPVEVRVYRSGDLQPLMNASSMPPVGEAGDAVRVDLNLGTDEDGDGLSDLWETQLIIWNSGGLFTDIAQVLPGDDFDGDGASNIDEFNSGSAPEYAGDVFKVYDWMRTSEGLLAVRFLTVKGTTYELQAAPPELEGQGLSWARTPFRTSSNGGEVSSFLAPVTGWRYFYVPPQPNMHLIRLEIAK